MKLEVRENFSAKDAEPGDRFAGRDRHDLSSFHRYPNSSQYQYPPKPFNTNLLPRNALQPFLGSRLALITCPSSRCVLGRTYSALSMAWMCSGATNSEVSWIAASPTSISFMEFDGQNEADPKVQLIDKLEKNGLIQSKQVAEVRRDHPSSRMIADLA